jgi:hypothetical protein
MTNKIDKSVQILALIVGLSVLQVYGTPVRLLSDSNSPAPTLSGRIPFARLTTGGNAPIIVNGATGRSGDTIFSGQSIQTPSGVGATITIPGIGRVDASPNSRLEVNFSQANVSISAISGCVVLATLPGVAGAVVGPDVTRNLDAKSGGTLDVCAEKNVTTSLANVSTLDDSNDDSDANASPASRFGSGSGFGTGYGMGTGSGFPAGSGSAGGGKALSPLATVLILGGAGAFVITAILISDNDKNPSPSRVG